MRASRAGTRRLTGGQRMRGWRRARHSLAAGLGPVLALAGVTAPPVAVVAAVVAGATVVAAGGVAAAPAAKAATPPGKALVLLQNGETSAPETTALRAAGWTVDQATPAAWLADSAATFKSYAVLVIGDPSTTSSCSTLTPTTAASGSDAIGTTWQSAVSGNVAVVGTAPAAAGTTAANNLVTAAVGYAASGYSSSAGTGTGLYVSLNCEYKTSAAGTAVPLLNGVEGTGAAGGLTVRGGLSCGDAGMVNKWEADAAGTFGSVTSDSLGTGSWTSTGCPVQEAFNSWPVTFIPAALDTASDVTANFTASDGVPGQPYVLLGKPVSAAAAATAQAETTGGIVPDAIVVSGGGGSVPGAVTPGLVHGSAGDGVDTESGDFSQSATDVSIPGFGPALGFTRTYDARLARQQQVSGTPGPLGYGWTDNWATSEAFNRPFAGDIYTVNTTGRTLGEPQDVVSDAAGNLFIADYIDNNVVELAASTHTQFGISMTSGHAYVVAGSSAGTSGHTGNGGAATSALLSKPMSAAVDGSGNLYIADSGNNRIQEVPASTGTHWGQSMTANRIYTVAGSASGTSGSSGNGGAASSALLDFPEQVRTDAAGSIYIDDDHNYRIQEVPISTGTQRGVSMTAGDIYTIAGKTGTSSNTGDGGLATSATFAKPQGLAVDAAGDVYVADSSTDVVREVAGTTHTQWGKNMTANHIYTVAGTSSVAGTGGSSGDGGPATSAQMDGPLGLAVDPAGDLYIADTYNYRIQEVPAASGTQWGQSMTAGDAYTVVGSAVGNAGTNGTTGDGGAAAQALLGNASEVSIDAYGDLIVPDDGYGNIREVFDSSNQLFSTTPVATGHTFIQADGARVDFQSKLPSGACPAGYVMYPGSAACTLTANVGAGYQQNPTTHVSSLKLPALAYDYSSLTASPPGALIDVRDYAGDQLNITAGSPAPGSGKCPSTASSCQTITAPVGTGGTARSLVIGSSSAGLVTSVTDPLGRRWTYAYNSASQLTSVTDPLGHVTSYTYGAGSTGNPQLASDLLTVTSPNAQPGGPDAGHATVNVYDSSGRVTSQTDPMGFATTFNYCVNEAAGDCMNPATGTGLVTVTDPDGNSTVDYYAQGTQAAHTSLTGTTVTSETDMQPDLTNGTLLATTTSDGNGNTTINTIDSLGNTTVTVAPAATGSGTTTTAYAESVFETEQLPDCATRAQATAQCSADSPPTPVAAGGVITPPSSAPPIDTTYTLYDKYGNMLYSTIGVYEPEATSPAYTRTSYTLYNGNTVTLPGTSTAISCAASAPSPTLPCASINADGVVTQLGYDSAGDLTSSSTPDGNGSEVATSTYAYDADGEQTRRTLPDGNLSGANAGNYTTVTTYNADGQKTSVTQAGGSGATVTPRATDYGYDANGNQTTMRDARGFTTTTSYNADNQPVLVADPLGNATLTCYDGAGNTTQTVPPAGVAASSLIAASCPAAYPAGYGNRLASDATTWTFDAVGDQTAMTTPAPAGQSGHETTTYTYDGNGSRLTTTAPPATGSTSQVTVDTYTATGKLATQTTGSGTPAASTTSYCYDPDGDRTATVAPDGNTSGVADCQTASPWAVSSASFPAQASFETTASYDSASEPVSATSPATAAAPSGATTTTTFDPAGNMLTRTDPNGVTTTWTYTPANLTATVSYSGSSARSVTDTYDADGQKTAMTDATGSSSYTLDPFGELTSATSGAGNTVGYSYDADGNTMGISYPLPGSATWATTSTVAYGYNNADVLSSVTDFNGKQITFTPSADSLPSSIALGSTGDTITATYDNTDSPSAIALKNGSTTLQSFSYTDAPAGNVTSEADVPASSQSPAAYAYNAKGQVTSMTPGTGSTLPYSFDASSNLTTIATGASASYDKNGEITSSTLAGTATSYAYNPDGQRLTTEQGGSTITSGTWNGAGQLTAYTSPAAAMTAATYDGNGLRASAATGSSQSFTWDTAGQLPVLLTDSANAYIYGSGLAPAEQVNLSTGTTTYLITDRLGSVRGTINSSGTLTGTTNYDAWGNPETAGGLAAATPFGFAGGYTDSTGLIYLINRYYDPATGQFTSIDPAIAQTLSPYGYAGGDPVDNADPTGLYWQIVSRGSFSTWWFSASMFNNRILNWIVRNVKFGFNFFNIVKLYIWNPQVKIVGTYMVWEWFTPDHRPTAYFFLLGNGNIYARANWVFEVEIPLFFTSIKIEKQGLTPAIPVGACSAAVVLGYDPSQSRVSAWMRALCW